MTKQRRCFSVEFKPETAALLLDQGYSHIEVCHLLGVVESAFPHWMYAQRFPQRTTDVERLRGRSRVSELHAKSKRRQQPQKRVDDEGRLRANRASQGAWPDAGHGVS